MIFKPLKNIRIRNQFLKQRSPFLLSTFFLLNLVPYKSWSQVSFAGLEALFTQPEGYTVSYVQHPPVIDGNIDEKVWKEALWTKPFVDIEGGTKPKPVFNTRAKMLWGDSCLFVAAELEETHVWATLKKRDNIIYHDNDFEVFIDPGNDTHQYFEIEINALNTVLDLFMAKPYRNGSSAMISYDVKGLKSGVKMKGSLNNPSDKDYSWTVEMAIPFSALYIGNQWKCPEEGTLWRINFSRVQWDTEVKNGKYQKLKDAKGKVLPEHNWVWSPQGIINMHFPERWGYVQFTKKNSGDIKFALPYDEKRRPCLWLIYYRQKEYHRKHGRFATRLQDLLIEQSEIQIEERPNRLSLEATSHQFTAFINDQKTVLSINDEGLVQQSKKAL